MTDHSKRTTVAGARAAVMCVLILSPSPLLAQAATATVSGHVVDESEGVLPDVEIIVVNVATGLERKTSTSRTGDFTLAGLAPGRYTLVTQRDGFAPTQVPELVLNVGDALSLAIRLTVAGVTESVRVTAEPTRISSSAAVGTVVDRQFVENMPLNGRSFQSLIALTPGVVVANVSSSLNLNPGQFSVNGQRSYSNYFTVDGVSANAGITANTSNTSGFAGAQPAFTAQGTTQGLVSVDALQEFRIQTSSYSPEFGRSPGGQVELVTRSGTNEFHGSLFEYLRNDAFDANDWFANRAGQPKPRENQHDFGGTLGGPIVIPGYNGRDRTFFFLSYEGLRLTQPKFLLTQVPSTTLRRNAAAALQPVLNAFPQPTGPEILNTAGQPTGMSQFADGHSDPSRVHATGLRIDNSFSGRFTIFGRYSDAPSMADTRNLSVVTTTHDDARTFTMGSGWTISNNVFNDLRANYTSVSARNFLSPDTFGGAVPLSNSLFFPITAGQGGTQFTQFILLLPGTSITALSSGTVADNLQHQINIVDSISVTKGTHAMKYGMDYRRLSPVIASFQDALAYSFSSVASLTSDTTSSSVTHRVTGAKPVLLNWSVYAQDTWRVHSRLTLTYGLRWEVNPSPHNSDGPDPSVLTGLDNPATFAVAPAGTPLYPTRYNNFAPRVGLAYSLQQRSDWETVLRGGGGVFYDLGSTDATTGFDAGFPFQATRTLPNASFPLTASQLTTPTVNLTPPFVNAKFAVYDVPHFDLPYTAQWNAAVEQGVGAHQTLTVSYVGNLGRRLLRRQNYSAPNPNLPGVVSVFRSDSTSDYEALQLQFRRRLSHAFEALVSYTFAHAIDDISDETLFGGVSGAAQAIRGDSNFDVRHNVAASASYSVPTPEPVVARVVLGGWAVDTIVRAQTGTPVDLLTTARVVDGVQIATRPDVVSGLPFYISDPLVPGERRFNTDAFVVPPAGRQGTFGRNILRGLGASEVDLALRRQFRLTPRFNVQFRVEAFNLFNHPNFGNLNLTVGNANLGVPQSMLNASLGGAGALSSLYQIGGPRSLQLTLKCAF